MSPPSEQFGEPDDRTPIPEDPTPIDDATLAWPGPVESSPGFGASDDSGFTESDATVLSPQAAIVAEDIPPGLTTQELAHALRGQMLDHFLLKQYIGGGGMGVVFRALDTTLDRDVAVKVVASSRVRAEDLQRRYQVEAQSTARLDHPNIASVYAIGQARGLPYIVFEFIEGENLRQLIVQRGPLPVAEALGYTYQIAHALNHAWKREVTHRDIKPSNILVTPGGQAKLVDMGLARLKQGDRSTDDQLTTSGVTLGTFDYISPEQARDPRSADTRSDIYSLGCTLFFMLTGRPPFSEGNMTQKLLQHQEVRPPDLRLIREDVPEAVDELVQRMLAKSPDDRYQNPAELITELAAIMRMHGIELPHALGAVQAVLSRRPVAVWRRIVPWAIPLAALLAFGFWMSRTERNEKTPDVEVPELRIPADTTQGHSD